MAVSVNLPNYPVFDCREDGRAVRWRKWVSRLENNVFVGYNIKDDKQKKALLLSYGGEELNDIVDTFPDGTLTPGEDGTHFGKLKDAISDYFNPKANIEFQRYTFRNTIQKSDDVEEFYNELKHLAPTCDFANDDGEIKSQLIAGCKSSKVREKGLSTPGMTLAELLTYARTVQRTAAHARQMEESPSVHHVKTKQRQPSGKPVNKQQYRYKQPQKQNDRGQMCNNCGGSWPHEGGQSNCPAFNKQCRSCGKYNHFSKVCYSNTENSTARSNHLPKKHHRVQHVNQHDHNSELSSSEEEFVYMASTNLDQLPHFTINMEGCSLRALADSGATVNLLSKTDYDQLSPPPKLSPCETKISAYGSKTNIPVIGKFKATISTENASTVAKICVVSGNEKPILSWETSQLLGLLTTVHNINPTPRDNQSEKHHPNLFNGIGCLKDQQAKLHIDTNVQPVAQRYRRVPFHVRKNIEEQLDKDEQLGVIEKASGPTPWVSPIVVVPKKQQNKVRVCVDMRAANKAIKRERHATPTLDELKTMLSGAKVFSKLDLNNAYNQIELAEESRYITTFATHKGLYRYRRLFFGVNSASEIFQEMIRQTLSGLEGCVNIADDILCYGSNQAEHDANLEAIFNRLEQNGLTLNAEKCEYNKSSIEFLGHVFGKDGMKPSPEKVKSIIDLPTPTNASEVRSLLGMMNFCGAHFIPNYATLTYELRQLTKQSVPWSWTEKHDNALTRLKTALSDAIALQYYDPKKHTEVYTDASPVGISAVLTQDGKVVQFASRALTATETRYSQTEREGLAITWACEHFHIYLFGAPFTVYTDHKPLLSMFNSPRAQLSARIERWVMRIQPYEMTVKYRPGYDNPADYLSRHPVEQGASSREEKIAEEYINYVLSTPKSITIEEVVTETSKDATLTAVIDAVATNRWYIKDEEIDFKTFNTLHGCRAELSVDKSGKILLKGCRIVLPESLHRRAVGVAHSGHQGITKTVALLREKVWFPNMNMLVEKTVRDCHMCQITTPTPAREPLKMSPLPSGPWQEVSADFGHLPNGQYVLVVTDEYSRYVVVDILDSTSARTVIPRFEKIFCEFGFPSVLKTDNGPPFNSYEFAQYAQHSGFKHRKITPLWPRANAETERFMRTIKKTIKGATAQQLNWKQEMYKFLLDYRNTPHCSTGVAPAEAFFGRKLKTRLPALSLDSSHTKRNIAKRDAEAKKTRAITKGDLIPPP